MPGLEYDNSIDDKPKFCLMVCVGLGWGVVNCCALTVIRMQNVKAVKSIFFM